MEFQAVVMAAGKGSRLSELTHGTRPKCLLPIGNRPMIWFTLKMLQQAGFEEAIVIVQEQHKSEVAAVPAKFGLSIKLDICCIPNTKNEDHPGTADSLRMIHDKIKTDVLVVSSDLVTDIPLQNLFDMHRTHNSSVTAMFCPVAPEVASAPVPGPKNKFQPERDLVGLDSQTPRLVFMISEADLHEEELGIPKSIMKYFPNLRVRSELLDAHVYVMKKWVCDYITENRAHTMLRGEIVPLLVRKQFSKPPKNRADKELPHPDVSVISLNTANKDIYSFLGEDKDEEKIRQFSGWNDHCGDLRGPYQDQSIRCFAYVAKEGLCLRANTVSTYCELNRQVIKRWSSMFPDEEVSLPTGKAQVGADCLIGEPSQLSDKCSIKHSIIGPSCHIGDKVKITNCILMDNVTVKEGTTLNGSVLMDGSTIEPRCDIKDCIVGSGHTVHTSSKSSNDVLTDSDHLLEI